jgi:nucleoside-diphosphate-sugar epimerase
MVPVTPYAISKTMVEDDLREMADDDFSPVYLRNATVYGMSPRLRVDVVLNNLVGWAHLTGEIKLLSDGTPWRPVVHVRDVAAAFLAALEAPTENVHNEAINVGDATENYRIRELAEIVGDTVPGSRVVITGEAGSDVRSYRVDFSKLARVLPEFHPQWDARRGATELYEAYRRFGLTREQFDERFVRLRWLSLLQREQRLGDDLRWSLATPAASTPDPTTS